jgi:hypothetical protein
MKQNSKIKALFVVTASFFVLTAGSAGAGGVHDHRSGAHGASPAGNWMPRPSHCGGYYHCGRPMYNGHGGGVTVKPASHVRDHRSVVRGHRSVVRGHRN